MAATYSVNKKEKIAATDKSVSARNSTFPQVKYSLVGENLTPVTMETPAHVTEVEELFKTLTSATNCHSLLRTHLTQDVFDKVKARKTPFGGTLADCIRSGCLNLDSQVGIYACDPQAYKVFSEVLDPVIKDYHKLQTKKRIQQPPKKFGDPDKLKFDCLDPEGEFIISTRISVARSLDGAGFHPVFTKESRQELEKTALEVFKDLTGEFKGVYYPLTGMDAATQARLTQDHFLFNDSDRFLKAAGGYDDWPSGRGLFLNEEKNLLIWVNEEDHLSIFSMEKGGDIGAVYKRMICAVEKLEEKLTFARDDHLGFLTFCPTNLGTTLRASVHIRIPRLAASDQLESVCQRTHLLARGVIRDEPDNQDGVYEISNQHRLGITELQVIQEMYKGIKDLIRLEKELSWWPENVLEMFEHLSQAKNCKSLLKKHLTRDIFEKLKDKKTSQGASLADCIITGVVHLDSEIGLYAADPESYSQFSLLFEPIIKDYHRLRTNSAPTHPASDFGDLSDLGFSDLDPDGGMIVSTTISVRRSRASFAFSPILTKEDRIQIEESTIDVLHSLTGELQGTYQTLQGMNREIKELLTKDGLLFNDNDRFLKAAGCYKDWPTGRGVFLNYSNTFIVWVNEEDHLRIISTQSGGDVAAVYRRLVTAVKTLEEKLTFTTGGNLGYLTVCPSNLGTALRASVRMKIPHVSARKDFESVCSRLQLRATAFNGNHINRQDGVYDISSKRCLGITEFTAINEFVIGIQEIVRLEMEDATGRTASCRLL